MNDDQISAFIDDQLELPEKIEFVEAVHCDRLFKEETISMLRLERRLRAPAAVQTPKIELPGRLRCMVFPRLKILGYFGGGLVTAMLLAAVFFYMHGAAVKTAVNPHRFVIYQPEARQAALIGSFSNWQTLEMQRAGQLGYWEVIVDLPPGEHRYSFLLDGNRRMPDPTRPVREQDDFGGSNSIVTIQS